MSVRSLLYECMRVLVANELCSLKLNGWKGSKFRNVAHQSRCKRPGILMHVSSIETSDSCVYALLTYHMPDEEHRRLVGDQW